MSVAELLLPPDTLFDLRVDRSGPIRAADFEGWTQEEGKPVELLEGWVLPMSPGNFKAGVAMRRLTARLDTLIEERGWQMSLDACHRLPQPPDTVVFPDIAVHCAHEVSYLPGTQTVGRVPELVIEILGDETAGRDRAPRGAKFLAYQLAGVREYFYAWPDGREAAGFRLLAGVFVPISADAQGFFTSEVLACRLRLAPAKLAPLGA